jgi:hypothetical protein
MTSDDIPFWHRVTRARSLLESGFYDDPRLYSDYLTRSALDRLLTDINNCPIGDGNRYRDIVAETLVRTLRQIVDTPFVQKEFQCHGGRGDIELPLRSEVLPKFPVWEKWSNCFAIRCVVIECKNLSKPASVGDIHQALSYLVTGDRGRFGMVVARNGFSSPARQQLAAIARTNYYLILPLSSDDLCKFAQTVVTGDKCAMTFLRRQETLLAQTR